jgi:hypothetical protein
MVNYWTILVFIIGRSRQSHNLKFNYKCPAAWVLLITSLPSKMNETHLTSPHLTSPFSFICLVWTIDELFWPFSFMSSWLFNGSRFGLLVISPRATTLRLRGITCMNMISIYHNGPFYDMDVWTPLLYFI